MKQHSFNPWIYNDSHLTVPLVSCMTIGEVINKQSKKNSSRIFITTIDDNGVHHTTYGELAHKVNHAATRLNDIIPQQTKVCLLPQNDLSSVVTFLALMKLGITELLPVV